MIPAIINIVSAQMEGDFRIRIRFDDSTQQLVDFKPFLTRAVHPDIRAYLDLERFAAFRIEHGELVWGDYDLCFPIIDLYCNQLEKTSALDMAA